ncbi:MAG: tRNA (adenosine(37)-N6)-dimethylallyltransferase MiaA [Chloroflexi bacterium RBG_19FT_COMBO_62_14]|nr:MAG: tRNA (adenosine(37)-N6)-dimethylallyltransferase MiaA [Chloroflexi bacterium RBG_19FT_COMBO_62_14]
MTAGKPLAAILGSTAVGKTELSIRLASHFDGEIVSADSRLVYRGLDVGTAKPTAEQQAAIPHHLIDVTDPDRLWSLATFRSAALEAIQAIQVRHRLPFLVGGTGQYVRAILEGWSPPPGAEDEGLRRELERFSATHGHEALHARLAEIDPVSAARIDSRNVRRVVRALEIHRLTNQPPSRVRQRTETPFRSLKIVLSLPRGELYARIDNRLEKMVEQGLVDEVRGLLARGFSPDLPAMSAIGYRQIVAHLQGKMTLEEALAQIRRASRRLVRHQANWFKEDDPENHVFEARPGVEEGIVELIRRWLESKIME